MFFIWYYFLILVFTIVIDYYAGLWIEATLDPVKRKRWLLLSVIANVGVLCVFKYYNFFTDNINTVLGFNVANGEGLPYLDMILPIGLSFHTFQAMSYTIEVYRGVQKAERHFGIYALYVMFYPQLVAGPIERPQNILHQFYEKHDFNYEKAISGMRLMLWGLFKKVVVADRLALYVDAVYDNPQNYEGFPLIWATLFFAFQVYCDFSGYSDIALGSARVMGFDLLKNFNLPYWSKSISDFWRKWHISLNTWFVDYVYTPIVVEKRHWDKLAVVFAIMVTFSLSGLWHGANWTFVVWGSLHGVALTYDFLSKKKRKSWAKKIPALIYNPLSWVITFTFVCFTYIFFRADKISDAFYVISHSSNINIHHFFGVPLFTKTFYIICLVSIAVVMFSERLYAAYKSKALSLLGNRKISYAYFFTLLLLVYMFGIFEKQNFVYFQF
jgi:D-alanyl-lipoteichoic acid acyltransferase DltB (MBOAT superfamily)